MDTQVLSRGLTKIRAQEQLERFGPNEISLKTGRTLKSIIVSQFNNFLILLLIVAACISLFVGERLDASFIFLIVILNALFGFYQEYKAEQSLAALKKMTITKTRVIRDMIEQEIDSLFLVPDDIIHIEAGTRVPADATLIQSWDLEIDESALTGESLPQPKSTHNKKDAEIFMGTTVVKGRAYAIVTNTGDTTKFGIIAHELSDINREPTPLQKKLKKLSTQIGMFGLAASVVVFVLSFIRDKSAFESFLFSVSLAVAAVPEGLPAVMTITLAMGVKRMAGRNAIVRRLESIEALGSVTLLATDKTGTLTSNEMTVKKVFVSGKFSLLNELPKKLDTSHFMLFLNGIVCSTASLVPQLDHGSMFDVLGDPTEGALLKAAQSLGLDYETVRRETKKLKERSFDSTTKRMSVVVEYKGVTYCLSKGAPESILSICKLSGSERKKIEESLHHEAKQGYRLIAFSYKKGDALTEKDHTFLGFVTMADPIRPQVPDAVVKAQRAGIKVVMITGDSALTAQAIGIEAGIISAGEDILEGHQIDAFSDKELMEILPHTKIFARTTPLHKYRLVKLFREMGEIVVVTGDGVNDALALKQADVGVAMGKTGTDVAKETADMIITDDNFASLVDAVEEGRNIFTNIKKAITYLLATNLAEVIVVVTTIMTTSSVALTALQILYINLVSDGLPALSLAFTPASLYSMNQKKKHNGVLLEREDMRFILTIGILGSLLTLAAFFIGQGIGGVFIGRTMAFTTIIFIQPFILLYLWSRHSLSRGVMFLKKPLFAVAFFLPFFFHPFILHYEFFNNIFHTAALTNKLLLFSLLISTLILLPLELTRIKHHAGKI